VHFTAEGEVSFKSILYVPKTLASDAFQNYGKTEENIIPKTLASDAFQNYGKTEENIKVIILILPNKSTKFSVVCSPSIHYG
jgi:hypothetical protein